MKFCIKRKFIVFILLFSSFQAIGKAPSSIEDCWSNNQKCMSQINTFSEKNVDTEWLREFAPVKIIKKLPPKAALEEAAIGSSMKWKLSSAEGKIHIESLTQSLGIEDKKVKLPSMSYEEWAKHCNKLFKDCEANLAQAPK